LFHASTESPVSGIEYWGQETIDASGVAEIIMPEYFEGIAKPDNRAVLVQAQGAYVTWSDVTDGKFTVNGPANTKFSWLVKAERYGGDFEVVQDWSLNEPPGS
jgi:hypothetical protein